MALPPVIATLVADTKEYSAKMDESIVKMREMGAASESTSSKMAGFASTASSAILGVGVALGGYAVDQAYKYQEALDKIQNQAGLSGAQIKALGNSILTTSSQTGVSTSDLATAALQVEQAGIRGTAAMNLLNVASQAAVITNSSVANTTMAVVSAEKLHITQGQSVATTMGILVAGSKNFVGGLQAESSMLSGRVGVALSQYGLNLKTVIGLGQVFAQVGLPSRSIAGFASGLGRLEAPLMTIHATAKKTYTTLSTYALGLRSVGLSADKLQGMLKDGNISGILQSIKDQAAASHQPLQQLINMVFGTGGGVTASVLVKNLNELNAAQKQLAGAGAGSLHSGFKSALTQLGPQLHVLGTRLNALMIKAGTLLLPKVSTAVSWANSLITYFQSHPLVTKIASDTAIALFAGALTTKLAGVGLKMAGAFGLAFTEGLGVLVGGAIAAGVAVALGINHIAPAPNSDISRTRRELHKSKVGGAYDIAAMTFNEIVNAGIKIASIPNSLIPGHHSYYSGLVPNFPVIGPGAPQGHKKGSGAPGWGSDTYTVTVNHKMKAKVTG